MGHWGFPDVNRIGRPKAVTLIPKLLGELQTGTIAYLRLINFIAKWPGFPFTPGFPSS